MTIKRLLLSLFLKIALVSFISAQVREPSPGEAQTSAPQTSPKTSELAEAGRLNDLVVKLYRERKYDEALPLAERVVSTREKHLGPEHVSLSGPLMNLAALSAVKGNRDRAVKLLKRILPILEKTPETDTVDLPMMYFTLAEIHLLSRDYRGALPVYERGLAVWERVPKADPDKIRDYVDHYFCLLAMSGQSDKARAVLDRLRQAHANLINASFTGVIEGKALSKPVPAYPPRALQARISGVVVVKIIVDETGAVAEAKAMCGDPILGAASEDAARRARFSPTLLNGQPVKVSGLITYNFALR